MKHFILFLALASVGLSQGGNLSVNLSTGAIRGPVTAEQFKAANDLGGVTDFSELTGTPTTLLGYGITDGILASAVNGYFADPSTNGSFSASAWRSDLGGTTVGQNIFTVANPGAVRWLRINADNTVTLRTAAEARADLDLEPGTDFLAYPTGTPTGSKFLRDDNSFQTIPAGDVTTTGTNAFTSGTTTFNSGTTVAFNGAVNMAPTGGTWDLSLLTISFGTLNVTTLNATGLNIGGDTLAEYIASLGYVSAGGNIGAATATTPAADDDSTKVATTAWVQDEIAGLSSGSGIAAGMGLFWQTADLGSLSSDYFAAGLYGTGTGGTVGDWTLITKSLGTLATPTVSPAAGEIADGSTITFSSTDSGVTFRHTTSGTDPTYTTGTTGATATLSGDTTYEFIATKPGYPPSAVASVAYTIPAGPTYLISEDSEASGAGWTTAAGSPTWTHTGTILAGSSSLEINGSDSTYKAFTSNTTVELYMLIRFSTLPSTSTVIAYFGSGGGTRARFKVNGTGNVIINADGTDSAPTTEAMSTGVTYRVWMRYVASGTCTIAFTPFVDGTDTRPSSGDFFQSDPGNAGAADVLYISAGGSDAFIADTIRVLDGVISATP